MNDWLQKYYFFLLMMLLFPFAKASAQPNKNIIPIAEVKIDIDHNYVPDKMGDTVTVAGRASVGSGILRTAPLFLPIQDNTGGIFLYNKSYNGPVIHAGDSLVVVGVVGQYKGLTQILHPQIYFADTVNSHVPEAVRLKRGDFEQLEGSLVKMRGRIINKGKNEGGSYLLIAPGEGSNNTLFVFNSLEHSDNQLFRKYRTGEMIMVTGVLSQFDGRKMPDGVYQLLPRSQADLQIVERNSGYYSRLALIIGLLALTVLIFNLVLQKKVRHRTRKLKASESRFAKLAGSTTSAIMVYQDGQFVYQNPVMASITQGGDLKRLLDTWKKQLKEPDEPINAHREFHYQSIDGQTVWLVYTSVPIIWNERDALIITATNISKRKEAEHALKQSEKRFQSMAESATVGIFRTRPDGYTTYVNPKWIELSGLPLEEATGYGWMKAVHPDDRKWLLQRWSQDSNEANESFAEYRFQHPDGRIVWVLGDATPEFSSQGQLVSFVGTITDITQQKLNEQKIQRSEKHYKYLFHNNPQPMLIYDNESFRFLEVNDVTVHHYGYSREEFLSMTIADIRPQEDIEKAIEVVSNMEGKYNNVGIWRHRKKSGEIIFVEITNHLITYDNREARLVLINDVTERLKVHQTLEESEKSLNEAQVIARMGDWEYYPIEQKTTCSENNYRLFGLQPGEIAPDITYFIDRVHPADSSVIEMAGQELMRSRQTVKFDYRITQEDGKITWLSSMVVPYFENGNLVRIKGINIDITERKHTLERLKLLDTSVEQSPMSVMITNPEGIIEFVNPNFTRSTGFSTEEVVGQTPAILKSGYHSREFYHNLWSTIKKGEIWNGEIQNRKKNGELFWERVLISPVKNERKEVTHFVSIREDVTEKKRLFDELVEAKEKAEESNQLKSAFLANISHEIRTPMNSILGFSELLKLPELSTEEKEEFLEIIEQSGKRMLNTITKIVEISRIDTNQVDLALSPVHVNHLLRKIEMQFEHAALDKQLCMDLKLGLPDDHALLQTDEEKLETVIKYLLDNAFKYTQCGSVNFGYRAYNSTFQFFVEDTGIGMDQKASQKIFRPFVQTSNTYTRDYEGLGLGLVIAKGYIEKLGGRIALNSEPKKGTTITFTLPYHPV